VFWEGHELRFRFEAFNFPNRPNFGFPDSGLLSASFGRISGTATTMREIQFGLKYVFGVCVVIYDSGSALIDVYGQVIYLEILILKRRFAR